MSVINNHIKSTIIEKECLVNNKKKKSGNQVDSYS